jgi:two-component system, chemotaxis family, chemotaxis protein CheY
MMKKSHVIRKFSELLSSINVLIVDNNEKAIELMGEILKKLGFTSLHFAQDGFQAMEVLKKRDMDLIITDWELRPVGDNAADLPTKNSEEDESLKPVDGGSFVKYVRMDKSSPDPYIPIMMLTGRALLNNVEYARDAGVNEILIKPVIVETLCKRIIMIVDDQRPFITAEKYKGPCRRRRAVPYNGEERRKLDIKIIKNRRA